ncbi:lipopolysaccharide biosynthesis protein [Teredinibacter purpureus]|uniref:lipopolysaccharide biosynthesis protein n=1 Tax=Teredinibacter purpureus TaxID=2731756 RepID=UPI0005F80799|nr:lipopolysaccharide biosynthesis protein [Teredinibacter purpureus]
MSKVKRAVYMSVVGQYSLQIINFVTVAVLARLLSPDEVGLFSVATSIAFIAIEMRSFGVAEFLVREKEIDEGKIKSVLGVMVIMSWGLGFILLACSFWIAEFYKVDDLKYVLWIITIPFFFAPHSAVPAALLSREMNFDAMLAINLAGCVSRSSISIGLVLLGYSYYGLAYGTLAGVITEFLAITYYRPSSMPWLPTFKNISHIFRVGLQISVAKFLNSSAQNASDLLLGRIASMHAVGMYSRGLGLILFLQSLLVKAVGPVALPHLSEVQRNGGCVKEAYLNSVVLIGALSIPIFAVVHLSADVMINALFGDQWGMAVDIASVLSLWAILQTIHCFSGPVLLTLHKEKLFLIKEAISIVAKIILIIVAIPYGLTYVAWGFVVSAVIDYFVVSIMLKRILALSLTEVLRANMSNFLVAAICWLLLKGMMFVGVFEGHGAWASVGIIGLVMVPVWLLTIKLTGNAAWPHVAAILERIYQSGSERFKRSAG